MSGAQRGRLAVGGVLALLLLYWFFRGMDWERARRGPAEGQGPAPISGGRRRRHRSSSTSRGPGAGATSSPPWRACPFVDLFSATMVGFMIRPDHPPRRRDRAAVPRLAPLSRERVRGVRHDHPRAARRPADRALPLRALPLRPARARRADARSAPRPPPEAAGCSWARVPSSWSSCCSPSTSMRSARSPSAIACSVAARVAADAARGRSCGRSPRASPCCRPPLAHLLVIVGPVRSSSGCSSPSASTGTTVAFGIDLPFHTTFLIVAFLTVGVAIPTPGMVGGFHAFYLIALTEAFGVDEGDRGGRRARRPRPHEPARARARSRLPRPRRPHPRHGGAQMSDARAAPPGGRSR